MSISSFFLLVRGSVLTCFQKGMCANSVANTQGTEEQHRSVLGFMEEMDINQIIMAILL